MVRSVVAKFPEVDEKEDPLDLTHIQWEFQDPKMEVPTIYKAYVRVHTSILWYSTSILGSWNSH